MLAELHNLRIAISDIEGSVVATTDGMVVAHDLAAAQTFGVEPEGVAALAAVNLGLSQRIADTASHGDLRECVIRGAFGQVVTYAVGDRALLTVLVGASNDLSSLHAEARLVVQRVADLLDGARTDGALLATPSHGRQPSDRHHCGRRPSDRHHCADHDLRVMISARS